MYAPTERTTPLRKSDRMTYDEATVHSALDDAYHCDVSYLLDGRPHTLPTLHVRIGRTLYLHGSTGSRLLLAARTGGVPVCVAVTHLDGLVLGRSQFHHSANYRSVIAHGTATLVEDVPTKARAFAALVEKVAAGRAEDSRPPTDREMAQTAVLALPLTEVSARVRTGGPIDEPADHALPYWAGVLPMRVVRDRPVADTGITAPEPGYLGSSPWLIAEPMAGRHVRLEPLHPDHAAGLLASTGDDEVWRWLSNRRPDDVDGMRELIVNAVAMPNRTAWVQRSAVTGEIVGSTSYHNVDPASRSLAIGYTWLGRPWWRTGVNTEAKLLLLERAFEQLAAVRVEWHTDLRNVRSQAAIERLGAVREGVLRSHRRRPDGTWRDTVLYSVTEAEWPTVRDRLRVRLRPEPAQA